MTEIHATVNAERGGLNLHQKKCYLMTKIGNAVKSGRNDAQNYNYVREADVSAMLRSEMGLIGLDYHFTVVQRHQEWREFVNARGDKKTANYVALAVQYTLINADDPSQKSEPTICWGEAQDQGDKAGNKALTTAHKYFLIRTFNLGSDDDSEQACEVNDGYSPPKTGNGYAPKYSAPPQIPAGVANVSVPPQLIPGFIPKSEQRAAQEAKNYPPTENPSHMPFAWKLAYDKAVFQAMRQANCVYWGKKEGGDGLWYGTAPLSGALEAMNRYLVKGATPAPHNGGSATKGTEAGFDSDEIPF